MLKDRLVIYERDFFVIKYRPGRDFTIRENYQHAGKWCPSKVTGEKQAVIEKD